MTAREIVAIGLRILALWVFVFSLQIIPVLAFTYGDLPRLVFVSTVALGFAATLFLWRFAGAISGFLVSKASADQVAQMSHAGLFQVGCCLIGLLTIASALSEVLRALGWIFISSGVAYTNAGPQAKLTLLAELLRLAVGFFLLLRSNMVTRATRISG